MNRCFDISLSPSIPSPGRSTWVFDLPIGVEAVYEIGRRMPAGMLATSEDGLEFAKHWNDQQEHADKLVRQLKIEQAEERVG